MPFNRTYIHYVWATKNRESIITQELKPLLIQHIKSNCIQKGIYVQAINCVADHMHMLVALETDQTIAKNAMLIKGESSYWVNKEKLIRRKFAWQDEYISLSVSPSDIDTIRVYIRNQEAHHRLKTFMEEYNEFINGYDPAIRVAKATR